MNEEHKVMIDINDYDKHRNIHGDVMTTLSGYYNKNNIYDMYSIDEKILYCINSDEDSNPDLYDDNISDEDHINNLIKELDDDYFDSMRKLIQGIRRITDDDIKELTEFKESLKRKEIPDDFPDIYLTPSSFKLPDGLFRDDIIQLSGFSMIFNKWVKPFSEWIGKRKCLEVMAGNGMLSKALLNHNVNLISTDNYTWNTQDELPEEYKWFTNDKLWTDTIENIDAVEAVRKYGKDIDIVICSWAPYSNNILHDVLVEMRKVNPELILVHIGEGYGGSCANDNFFEIADPLDVDIDLKANFKSHYGIYDYIQIYK